MTESNADGIQHITFEELADLADLAGKHLSAEQRANLLARVQADPAAAAELAHLQRVIDLMRSDTTGDAPDWVINRAVRLFPQRRAQIVEAQPSSALQQLSKLVRRIVAVLQFDSAQSPLAYGVRSGDAAAPRQLLFGGDNWTVDVRIGPEGSLWRVTGQLLDTGDNEGQGGNVVLRNEATVVETTLSEMCEFSLPPIPAGTYELTLRVSEVEVVIPNLTLDARPSSS